MKTSTLLAVGLPLLLLPSAHAGVTYRKIVLGANQTGDPAPGTPKKFGGSFKHMVINRAGSVVFQADLAGTGTSGIWLQERTGPAKLIAIEGGAAPGTQNGKFTDLDFGLSLDANGAVAFYGVTDLPPNKQGVWLTDPRGVKPAPVAFTGVALPEEGATPSGIDTLPQVVNGRVGFNASFAHFFGTYWIYSPANLDSEPRSAVFAGPRKSIKRAFWSETPTGVPNLAVDHRNSFLGAWRLNGLGEVAVEYTAVDSTFNGVPYGISIASPQGPVQGRSEVNQTIQGAAAVVQLGPLRGFNDDSEVLMGGSVGATSALNPKPGLFAGPLLDLRIVVLAGDPAPGAPDGSVFNTAFFPAFASSTAVTWKDTAILPANGGFIDGIWLGAIESTPQAVAIGGTAAPGMPNGVKFATAGLLQGQEGLFVNRQGVVAFIGGMEGISGYDPFSRKGRALFAGKPGALEVIAHGGDPFEVGPNDTRTVDQISVVKVGLGENTSIEGGGRSALNEANEITFGLTFTDGTSGIFVAKLDLATPANIPPTARNDLAGLRSGNALVTVLDNDSDVNGDKLTITAVSAPGFGTASIVAKTKILYKPGKNFSGTDTFTYTVADGRGGSDIGTVTIDGPFPELAGTYTQLVTAGPDGTQQSPVGVISAKISAAGVVSGTVTLRGTTYVLKGSAGFDGSFDQVIKRKGADPLAIHLEFAVDGMNVPRLTAHIAGDEPHYYNVLSQPIGTTTLPSGLVAGAYTVLLPPDATAANPRGIGWATATLAATGSVKLAGRLADGTPFSVGTAIDSTGKAPVYVPLYLKPKGDLIGTLDFQAQATSDFTGTLTWRKPAQTPSGTLFPAGFTATTSASGKRYVLVNGTRALTYTVTAPAKADVPIRGGGLPDLDAVITVPVTDIPTVDTPNPNGVKVAIVRKSGLVSGSFLPTGAKKPTPFTGVLHQGQNRGAGFFLGAAQSGTIEIKPR